MSPGPPMELMMSPTTPPAVPLMGLLTLPMERLMGQLLALIIPNQRRNYPCNMCMTMTDEFVSDEVSSFWFLVAHENAF